MWVPRTSGQRTDAFAASRRSGLGEVPRPSLRPLVVPSPPAPAAERPVTVPRPVAPTGPRIPLMPLLAVVIPAMIAAAVVLFWRAVIVGHLDTVDGPAVFAALPEIRRGMRIEIDAGNGTQHSFETIGVASVAKSSFPAQSVYAPSRRPTLALITCSGRFDESTGHYEDNLIILARAT
jgi:hypothetical protein